MTLTSTQQRSVPEIRVAVMRLARRLRNERHDDQLTPSQMAVLGTVFRDGPKTAAELAAIEHVQPPSMTRIVTALESGGMVTRRPHPGDRRQVLVEVTERGRAWVMKDRERRDVWLSAQMESLTDEERSLVMAAVPVLNRLATAP